MSNFVWRYFFFSPESVCKSETGHVKADLLLPENDLLMCLQTSGNYHGNPIHQMETEKGKKISFSGQISLVDLWSAGKVRLSLTIDTPLRFVSIRYFLSSFADTALRVQCFLSFITSETLHQKLISREVNAFAVVKFTCYWWHMCIMTKL